MASFEIDFDALKPFLNNMAEKNQMLINKWILGKPKNLYYKVNNVSPINKNDNEYYALILWTIPSKIYDYKELNKRSNNFWNKYCNSTNTIRSSIIPFVNFEGKKIWLLGSFHDYDNTENPILTDFGGKCEAEDRRNKCPNLRCAMRELEEESKNLLSEVINSAIQNQDNYTVFEGTYIKNKHSKYPKNEHIYFMFVQVKYDDVKDIPTLFSQKKSESLELGKQVEKLGKLGFYDQNDLLNFKYRTSKNLTDLIMYFNKSRIMRK